jgi:hypothetical protein
MQNLNDIKSIQVAAIYCTKDYSIFSQASGNRKINPVHVIRLKNSFNKHYLLCPISVNEKYEIIDGQHRFEAAKELGLPIYYFITEGYGLKEIKTLNTNMSNWEKEDHLQAFCNAGYVEYLQLRHFKDKYPHFSLSTCIAIMTNSGGGVDNRRKTLDDEGRVKQFNQIFKEGGFKSIPLFEAIEIANKINDFSVYFKSYNTETFVRTAIAIFKHKNYNHAKMLSKLSLNPTALKKCALQSQYRLLLEEIFNYKSRDKVSLRF